MIMVGSVRLGRGRGSGGDREERLRPWLCVAGLAGSAGADRGWLLPECEPAGRGTWPLARPRRRGSGPSGRSEPRAVHGGLRAASPGDRRAARPPPWPVRDLAGALRAAAGRRAARNCRAADGAGGRGASPGARARPVHRRDGVVLEVDQRPACLPPGERQAGPARRRRGRGRVVGRPRARVSGGSAGCQCRRCSTMRNGGPA